VTGRSPRPWSAHRRGRCGCTNSCGGGFARSRVGVLRPTGGLFSLQYYGLVAPLRLITGGGGFWSRTCYSGDSRLQIGRCLYKVGIGSLTIHWRWLCWFWASAWWRSSRSRSSCGWAAKRSLSPNSADHLRGARAEAALPQVPLTPVTALLCLGCALSWPSTTKAHDIYTALKDSSGRSC
jgi:hypothetical protein